MSTESALLDYQRMQTYKKFSQGFSYPREELFEYYPEWRGKKREILVSYDRLFRSLNIWLYTAEYLSENEFQKANLLSDIMGFYRAVGVEPDNDRPDSLNQELEFMYYLIFKRLYALENEIEQAQEKADLSQQIQKKFFFSHLYPGAKQIIEKISELRLEGGNFYSWLFQELNEFLNEEKKLLQELK